jgi:hypothetical protein
MDNFTLKPMSVIGIIDQTIKLYRRNFKAIILFTLLIGGTANLIVSLLQLGTSISILESPLQSLLAGQFTLDTLISTYSAAQPNLLASLLSFVVNGFINPLVMGGVTFVALAASHGTIKKNSLSQVCSKYGKLLGTYWAEIVLIGGVSIAVLIILLIFAGIGFSVGFIIAAIVLAVYVFFILFLSAFAFPVAIQEGRYGFAWLPRAWKLFISKTGKTIGLLLLTSLFVLILSLILQGIFAFFPPLISTVGNVLVSGLLSPISYIAVALLYLDIRIRTEGYDLEIRLASMENEEEIWAYDE